MERTQDDTVQNTAGAATPSGRHSVAETLIGEPLPDRSLPASGDDNETNESSGGLKDDVELMEVIPKPARSSLEKPEEILPARSNSISELRNPPLSDAILLHPHAIAGEDLPNIITSLPPPPPYDLIVKNLTVGVPPPAKQLPLPIPVSVPQFVKNWFKKDHDDSTPQAIVQNVSTRCASGEMLAIIGGSGSGKTTVLNAIVGRLSNLPMESGEIAFAPSGMSNSERKVLTSRKMKDKIGFVKQQDTLLSYLTVRETLYYAAALRLPAGISKATRESIVDQTIEELGLRDAADTVVGGALRKGISGGERRRLSIGCALVSMPSVLVADESTTGLDAFTSYNLLLTLSQLARRNRTVILTLHQPRSSAFRLFDRILLLSKGRVVFSGHRDRCLPWFASVGLEPETTGINPLDWLIDISTVDLREGKEEESRIRVERLVNAWQEGGEKFVEDDKPGTLQRHYGIQHHNSHPVGRIDRTLSKTSIAEVSQLYDDSTDWDTKRIGQVKQTIVLLGRANKNVYRNYGQMLAFACQAVGLAIFLGLAFFRLEENPADIQSLKTLSFQHLPYYTYLTLIYWVFKLCTVDLIVFDREREDHLYASAPWVLSEFISTLPIQAAQATTFAIIVYFVCNMRPGAEYVFTYVAVLILAQLTTTGMAYVAAACNRVYATASMIANATQVFFVMSAGFLLLRPPVYYHWVRFISIYYYGFRATVLSQFKNRTFACEGIAGPARNQCEGNQVLNGLRIPVDHSPEWYLAGQLGLAFALYAVSGIILTFYRPGGVKHAAGRLAPNRGKETIANEDMDIVRQRVDVEVRNLGIKWARRSQSKRILTGINARFNSGEVTAVLGPSGAGKSTLLQLLAARHLNAGPFARFDVEGEILFNGQPRSKSARRALVSFVEQDDDYHLPALTVRETLTYAAILRLPHTMSRKRKVQRAEEVLTMLGLSECADNMVGSELLKGISGGEKRRLSLAVEMINDPSILIVDEPTSGLDSMTANNVMMALKAIAESGRTVIVSIHQPRSDIWHAGIDNVILLAKGGRTAYSGPKDEVSVMCSDVGHPIPQDFNPADWILDLVSIDSRGTQEEVTRARVEAVVDYWHSREQKLAIDKAETLDDGPLSGTDDRTLEMTEGMVPIYIALPVILSRMTRNLWRQQPVFWLRLQQAPLLGCIFLLCFQRLKNGPSGAQDRVGFIIQMVSPMSFVGVLNNVAIFPMDRDIYFHEVRSNGGYSSAAFLLAFSLVEIPLEIGAALLFAVITNVGAGMQTNATIFFEYALCAFALMSNGESFGIMFGCLTESMGFNVSLVSTFISLIVQICGVVSLSIPNWLNELAWATTLKYAARIMFINENVGLRLNCTPESVASGECLTQRGEELLALYGFEGGNPARYAGILVAVTIGYRLLAWVFLRLKVATL